MQQEFDVLLVRDAADVQQQRPFGIDAEARPKARAITRHEAIGRQSGGNDLRAGGDAVFEQQGPHRLRRHHDGIELIALGAREASRERAADRTRQQRHVVMQILFKEGVIGGDHRNARAAREAHAGIVRNERRVDVHQVEVLRLELRERRLERTPLHAPVLRIARHAAGGHAHHIRVERPCFGVLGHDECRLHTGGREVGPEGTDGSGDAVDARKVDVGNEQDAHERVTASAGSRYMKLCAVIASVAPMAPPASTSLG